MDEKTHEPLLSNLTLIVETAVKLRKDGHKVIIVSSGAIGVGLQRMDVERRPKHISKLQVSPPYNKKDCISDLHHDMTGLGSYRTVSPDESMGQLVQSSQTTYRPDLAYQKRHFRCE